MSLEEGQWIDVTTMGDNYQVEMDNITGDFRHRRFAFGGGEVHGRAKSRAAEIYQRAWIPGRPPSGYWKDGTL